MIASEGECQSDRCGAASLCLLFCTEWEWELDEPSGQMRLLASRLEPVEVVRLVPAYLTVCEHSYGPGYLVVWDTQSGPEPGGRRVSGPHEVVPRVAVAVGG